MAGGGFHLWSLQKFEDLDNLVRQFTWHHQLSFLTLITFPTLRPPPPFSVEVVNGRPPKQAAFANFQPDTKFQLFSIVVPTGYLLALEIYSRSRPITVRRQKKHPKFWQCVTCEYVIISLHFFCAPPSTMVAVGFDKFRHWIKRSPLFCAKHS